MDIVMVCRDRKELTAQTVWSMIRNAADWPKHRLLIVVDYSNDAWAWTYDIECELRRAGIENVHRIHAGQTQLGVGGAKNLGAAIYYELWQRDCADRPPLETCSGLLMFSDNDLFMLPEWDAKLEYAMSARHTTPTQLGGWRHPYHVLGMGIGPFPTGDYEYEVREVDAVTGNCFVIRWRDWLKYGPFDSNAIGPGQSEDYALSQRIRAGGGLVATLDPPVAIHCGLVNSVGEPATGWRECEEQITEQLAGLSAEMRNDILIMRPGDIGIGPPSTAYERPAGGLRGIAQTQRMLQHFDGLAVGPNTELPDGRTVAEAGLQPGPIVPSRYAPGGESWEDIAARLTEESRARVLAQLNPHTDSVFEQARKGLDMQPRNAPRQPRVYSGETIPTALNIASGQRPFCSTTELIWYNVDRQRVPPDRIPDIMCNVGVDPLPFADNSVRYVVIHQGLEHAGCGESAPMLLDCWRVLARGGSLIITVPDMRKLAARWLGGELDTQLFMTNVYGAYMGDEADRHKWGFDQDSLKEYLRSLFAPNGRCTRAVCPCSSNLDFDWRTIPGADIARDWWVLGLEVVKP